MATTHHSDFSRAFPAFPLTGVWAGEPVAAREISPVALVSVVPFRALYAGGCRKVIGSALVSCCCLRPNWPGSARPSSARAVYISTRQASLHVTDRNFARCLLRLASHPTDTGQFATWNPSLPGRDW